MNDINQTLEALRNNPFMVLDINNFLPASRKFKAYTVELSTIQSATGGQSSGNVVLQTNFILLQSYIALYGVKNGTTYAITGNDPLRDMFNVDVSSNNGNIFQKPTDVFSYNRFFETNALARLGMYFPNATQMDIVITRSQNTGSVNGANIIPSITFYGFEI